MALHVLCAPMHTLLTLDLYIHMCQLCTMIARAPAVTVAAAVAVAVEVAVAMAVAVAVSNNSSSSSSSGQLLTVHSFVETIARMPNYNTLKISLNLQIKQTRELSQARFCDRPCRLSRSDHETSRQRPRRSPIRRGRMCQISSAPGTKTRPP